MYVNPCNLSLNPVNTGVNCDAALLASAMFIFMPQSFRWTDAQVAASPYNGNFTAFIEDQIHNAPGNRWYPLFGNAQPINMITEANEADVTETLDDGSIVFIRYGKANRTVATVKGGYTLAAKLMQLPQLSFIEVDINGKIANYVPTPGINAGFPSILTKGLAPDMANLKTAFKNKLMLCFDKVAYFVNGRLQSPDSTEGVLAVTGLLDTTVTVGKQTQSITNIFVGVNAGAAQTDLVALYPGTGAGAIAQVTNFVVTPVAGGSPVTISAAVVVNGEVQLTGTFTTGTSYNVSLAIPSILKANGIIGYEGITPATVSIP